MCVGYSLDGKKQGRTFDAALGYGMANQRLDTKSRVGRYHGCDWRKQLGDVWPVGTGTFRLMGRQTDRHGLAGAGRGPRGPSCRSMYTRYGMVWCGDAGGRTGERRGPLPCKLAWHGMLACRGRTRPCHIRIRAITRTRWGKVVEAGMVDACVRYVYCACLCACWAGWG